MSKRIHWYLHTGFGGCTHDGEIEVPDDATEDQIEELAKMEAFNHITWGWSKDGTKHLPTEAEKAADSVGEPVSDTNAIGSESGAHSAEKR